MHMKYLVVNADDFGYSPGVNKGIIEAHQKGIVTSTSVLVDHIAANEAKGLSAFTDLSVGLHFEVKELVNLQAELERQVEKFVSIIGRKPDHLDTHKIHTTTPGMREYVLAYAKEHHIPARDLGYAKFIDLFFGMNPAGGVSVEHLKRAINEATDEYNELMCHVGYADDYIREHSSYSTQREAELKAICDPAVKEHLKQQQIELITWRDVPTNVSAV